MEGYGSPFLEGTRPTVLYLLLLGSEKTMGGRLWTWTPKPFLHRLTDGRTIGPSDPRTTGPPVFPIPGRSPIFDVCGRRSRGLLRVRSDEILAAFMLLEHRVQMETKYVTGNSTIRIVAQR